MWAMAPRPIAPARTRRDRSGRAPGRSPPGDGHEHAGPRPREPNGFGDREAGDRVGLVEPGEPAGDGEQLVGGGRAVERAVAVPAPAEEPGGEEGHGGEAADRGGGEPGLLVATGWSVRVGRPTPWWRSRRAPHVIADRRQRLPRPHRSDFAPTPRDIHGSNDGYMRGTRSPDGGRNGRNRNRVRRDAARSGAQARRGGRRARPRSSARRGPWSRPTGRPRPAVRGGP